MFSRAKFLLPVLAGVLLAGCSSQGATPNDAGTATPASLTVTVEPASSGPITTSIRATGNVAARKMVSVTPEATGLAIERVPVAEGDLVKKDQLLAQLETGKLQTQIDQQVAANRGFSASLEAAQLAYDRGQELSTKGNLSASNLQSRQSALDTARSTLDQGEAGLKSLQLQLAQAAIVAPVDGRLASASPAVGQIAQAGATLFSIIEDDDLEVQAKVPEQVLGKISQQQSVEIVGNDSTHVPGTVRAIAQQVDAATRLGLVYITLPASSGFRVGMSAQVSFQTNLPAVVTIPEAALIWRDGAEGVFIVDNSDKVHFVKVESGDHQDGRVIVVSGLTPGQSIAVDGVGFLNDGMQVRVADLSQAKTNK
jgi:RND family efflux transporter MFP subunit